MSDTITAEAITAAWRAESARLVGALTRMTRDLDLAEDLAQDALVSALESWPAQGVPDNPAAWLMTAAKRRAVDSFRRADNLRRKTEELGHGLREEDRLVIACRYFLELDELETAAALGWRRGTVKSRLSRALGRLRERVGEESYA